MSSKPKDGKEKYCICRSSDSKSFMIACESCDEWFHGKCIKITPDGASNIRKYYCEACREKDSSLSIKYRKPKKQPAPKPSKQKYAKRRKTVENKTDCDDGSVQCYGPQCVNAARINSKYCSDSCGLKLAAMRLTEIMPSRLQQWQQSTCIAEKKDKEVLLDIKRKQQECQARIQRLAERHKVIDEIVDRGKKLTVSKTESVESEDEENDTSSNEGDEELELYIHCVTCGHEIRQVNAVKHIERCYAKAEKDMLFESHIKSPGNYICDHFNTSSKSYCKKLKQICPEHAKDGKILDSEVCGCPLVNDIYSDNKTCDLCQEPKKHCDKHYRWERLRRAEIDGEIVREYYRWEELAEKERVHTAAIANRGGVMGLMLHQTVDHDALNAQHARQLHKITPSKPERSDNKPTPGPAAKVIVVAPPNNNTVQSQPPNNNIIQSQPPTKTIIHSQPMNKNIVQSQPPIIVTSQPAVCATPSSRLAQSRTPIIVQPQPPKIVLSSIPQTSGQPRIPKTSALPIPKNFTRSPTVITGVRPRLSAQPLNTLRIRQPAQQVIIVNPEQSMLEARRKSLAQEHSYSH